MPIRTTKTDGMEITEVIGKKSAKDKKKKYFRLNDDLDERIEVEARKNHRNFSQEIQYSLRKQYHM